LPTICFIDNSQHYEFHYFIVNESVGFDGPIFPGYSADPTSATPPTKPEGEDEVDLATYNPLSTPGLSDGNKKLKRDKTESLVPDEELEGFNANGSTTKVVDRRWYEKNKHIFPASVWENFDPAKDYTTGIRKDTDGNVYFFSTLNGKKA
jgi:protein FAM50